MERRRAPESFSHRAIAAFELSGLLCTATAIFLFFGGPDWPLWTYSVILGAAFVLSLVLFAYLMPPFQCAQCGRTLGREHRQGYEEGEPIRYCCPDCQIEWETDMHVPS